MLVAADNSHCGRLTEDLESDFTKGRNFYTKTITEAENLMVNYHQSKLSGCVFNDSEGIAFAEVEMTRPEWDITKVKCYNCNKRGHYSNECPYKDPNKATKDALTATMAVTYDMDKMENSDNCE
jgi:hypothetical protein